jgi:hypothetical protein
VNLRQSTTGEYSHPTLHAALRHQAVQGMDRQLCHEL